MTSEPLISVVTPFYNRREWLSAWAATLEAQTFRNFEAIVVDDGSIDGLAEALSMLRPAFPLRTIRLLQNAGGAAARNAGFDAARGRYVALLDSDDAWRPDKLEQHVRQFETAPDAERLVGLSRQQVSGARTFISPATLMQRDHRVGEYLFQRGGVIQSSAMVLLTALARAARFEESERGREDWTFALRLEALGARFEMLPDALTLYRDDARSDRHAVHYSKARFEWLDRYRPLLGEKPYHAARAAFASYIRDPHINSLAMIADGLRRGGLPLWRTVYYLAAWSFPAVRRVAVQGRKRAAQAS